MRLNDFIKRRDEYLRRDGKFNAIYITVFLSLLFANLYIVSLIPESWSIAYLIVFFALLISNVYLTNAIGKRRIANSGLNCKSCKSPLLGVPGDLAVTTGKCSFCGKEAFDP